MSEGSGARSNGSDPLTRLADLLPLATEEAAGAIAAVACLVADLHEHGRAVGGFSAADVAVDPAGAPLLLAVANTGDDEAARVKDVRSLGRLLEQLTEVDAGHRRWVRALSLGAAGGSRSSADPHARALAAAARRAMAATVHGPSARQVAEHVASRVPTARLPGHQRAEPARTPRWGREPARTRMAVLLVVAVSAAGFIGSRALAASPNRRAQPARVSPTTAAAPPLSMRRDGDGRTAGTPPTCPPVPGPLHADVDGDGCEDEVRFEGGILTAGTVRFAFGAAGDDVITGRWSCDSPATPALLRADGTIFVADGWATTDTDVTSRLVATVPDADGIEASDLDADGCEELIVHRRDGSTTTVRPGREP